MMKRRKFLQDAGVTASVYPLYHIMKSAVNNSPILGHGEFRYQLDATWGTTNPLKVPVKDCHEMVIDSQGRIILLTNHTKNNLLFYSKKGVLLKTAGHKFPGGHGLTLSNEGSQDVLFVSDNERHQVIKCDLDGNELMVINAPKEVYRDPAKFIPTETAVAENGDIYVADGYGEQFILRYSSKGELLGYFGGRGESDDLFTNAHGIAIDVSSGQERLLITDRMKNQFKYFTKGGDFINRIDLPGAFVCRPVIKNSVIYTATIWSYDGSQQSGFVSIIKDGKLVSAPGGCRPKYTEGKLNKMYQHYTTFIHPHDVCVDNDENIYVAQWNAGGVYPFKLNRV